MMLGCRSVARTRNSRASVSRSISWYWSCEGVARGVADGRRGDWNASIWCVVASGLVAEIIVAADPGGICAEIVSPPLDAADASDRSSPDPDPPGGGSSERGLVHV